MTDAKNMVDNALEGGRPWWQACCLGCGLFLLAIGGTIIFFAYTYTGPVVQSRTSLPSNFPNDILFFHMQDVKHVTYIPHTPKQNIFSKFVSPFQLLNIIKNQSDISLPDKMALLMSQMTSSTSFITYMNVIDADTVFLDWDSIPESQTKDVTLYYQDMLKRTGFDVHILHDDTAHTDIIDGERSDTNVQVDVNGHAGDGGIDEIRAVVNYRVK